MTLIDQVRNVCERLAPHGWRELLSLHGLDITARDLKDELLKELHGINRNVRGFEDFASKGRRGIEPRHPDHSLLLHALASPGVVAGTQGETLGAFPTLAEIKIVENFVFGVEPPSLADLGSRFPGAPMAVVVFATEYRPAPETVHRRHAALCYSRTGVARVGTTEPLYDGRRRGFLPFVEEDEHAFRVLPAQYAPYIAVQLRGNEDLFGPMNFNLLERVPEGLRHLFGATTPPNDLTPLFSPTDQTRLFWVPLHKLFAGEECLRDFDLSVNLIAHHVNEKLRRVHLALRELPHTNGWRGPGWQGSIDQPPFAFTDGIAEFSQDPSSGVGMLTPIVHERLVEPATYQGESLTFMVPPTTDHGMGPTLMIASHGLFRHAPEFVHVRHVVEESGTSENLNDQPNVGERMRQGNYPARHYVDFTGDGWIEASCPELAAELPPSVPAYSMVTAPDFYPGCNQRELIEWWIQPDEVPETVSRDIWRAPPITLSDARIGPNLQLKEANFHPDDNTVTAIVSLPAEGQEQQRPGTSTPVRHRHLPDSAAGFFAPGWDTSIDKTQGPNGIARTHLAAYGLGSPFPEDAKLCAAISSFWPAVAPDAGRSFSKVFRTVTPMTDEEIGSVNDLPWDGILGPRPVSQDNGLVFEYASFDHVDYVQQALDNRFSLALTGHVDFAEYSARILAMARAYEALNIKRVRESPRSPRERPRVLSFRPVASHDEELRQAEAEAGVGLRGSCYLVIFGRDAIEGPHPGDHRSVRVEMRESATLFVGELPRVLFRQADTVWEAVSTF